MNRYNSLIIITLIIFIFSCKNHGNEISNIGVTTNVKINNDSVFLIDLDTNNKNQSDSMRVEELLNSDFFKESISESDKYVLIFNHILKHENEEFDEAISQYLFEMFSTYPSKFLELDTYLSYLDDRKQNIILSTISMYISSSYLLESSDSAFSEKAFLKRFPYLDEKRCVKYYRQAVENY